MGIDNDGLVFLRAAQRTGVSFERTCTIGRQALSVDGLTSADGFAESLFRELGALFVDSLDYSDYEGSNIIHDLNGPDPPNLAEGYTAVVDGGSLEHVFNVPNALRSIMSMVAPGGHALFINPADGHSGHGFYQFSPEFYYRALSPSNGYQVTHCYYKEYGGRKKWHQVPDPADLGRRILLTARSPAYLYVIARRTAVGTIFAEPPLQSDYVTTWGPNGAGGGGRRRLGRLPLPVRCRVEDGIRYVRRLRGPRGTGLVPVDLEAGAR